MHYTLQIYRMTMNLAIVDGIVWTLYDGLYRW